MMIAEIISVVLLAFLSGYLFSFLWYYRPASLKEMEMIIKDEEEEARVEWEAGNIIPFIMEFFDVFHANLRYQQVKFKLDRNPISYALIFILASPAGIKHGFRVFLNLLCYGTPCVRNHWDKTKNCQFCGVDRAKRIF